VIEFGYRVVATVNEVAYRLDPQTQPVVPLPPRCFVCGTQPPSDPAAGTVRWRDDATTVIGHGRVTIEVITCEGCYEDASNTVTDDHGASSGTYPGGPWPRDRPLFGLTPTPPRTIDLSSIWP
jgi:hypothetical protein